MALIRSCAVVAAAELALVGDWSIALGVVAFAAAFRAGDALLPR